MTASETLKLIAKQWCNLSDLMKLAGVGRNESGDSESFFCFRELINSIKRLLHKWNL